jgi:hypothetical protein
MQTSVTTQQELGVPGMPYDSAKDVVTRVSTDAGEIPFGVALVRGATDNAAKMPAAAADKFVGIAVFSQEYEPSKDLGTTGLKTGAILNVGRKGRFWVTVEEAVAPGDKAHIRFAAGAGGTQKGAWRKSTVADETIDITAVAEFQSTALAAGLAIVEINLP